MRRGRLERIIVVSYELVVCCRYLFELVDEFDADFFLF